MATCYGCTEPEVLSCPSRCRYPLHPGFRAATLPTVRQCSRPGCSESASVTLTYQYGRALVWLDDLVSDRDPHAYDLCDRHAGRLSVPNGWRLEDRRPMRLMTIASRLAG